LLCNEQFAAMLVLNVQHWPYLTNALQETKDI